MVKKMSHEDEMGLSAKVVAHNIALLDALAELSEAKTKITEEFGQLIKALVIKAGGEVNVESVFISAAGDPSCVLGSKIGSDDLSIRVWIDKHEVKDQ